MSQKLRASCNACNLAKVKCTKTRPTCARCAKHGDIECVYSVSLRAGKRPAQGGDARFKKLGQSLTDSSGSDARFTSSGSRTDIQATDARSRSPVQSATGAADEWALDPSATADLMAMDNEMYLTMVAYEKSAIDTPPLFDTSSSSPSSSLCPNNSSYDSLRETWYRQLPDNVNPPPYIFQQRQQSTAFCSTPSCPTSPPLSPPTTVPPPVCRCFKTVLSTLSNLQTFSSHNCPTFDVALARNKEAVTLCLAALRCTCPGDITVTLLIVSLIEKILSIYQSSCNAWCQSSRVARSSSAIVSASARVTLGVYNLDQEDEECIKVEFVRMELRKVEGLVLKLKNNVSKGQPEYEAKLYEALMMFLERKLRLAYETLLLK